MASVPAELQEANSLGGDIKVPDLGPGHDVEDKNGVVLAAGSEPASIGTECDRTDTADVSEQRSQLSTGQDLPKFHRAVAARSAAGSNQAPIVTELDLLGSPGVAALQDEFRRGIGGGALWLAGNGLKAGENQSARQECESGGGRHRLDGGSDRHSDCRVEIESSPAVPASVSICREQQKSPRSPL